jgi:myo-inositol-1(or 4)-monophosphatase
MDGGNIHPAACPRHGEDRRAASLLYRRDVATEHDDAGLSAIEALAADLAGRAGETLRAYFRTALAVDFKQKDNRDPVTEADREVETMVQEAVRSRFPDHGVLGEEGASTGGLSPAYLWVVDPLDGTNNFVHGLPLFASSIGVLHNGVPVAGAIYVPAGNDLESCVFHARRGGGLFSGDAPVPPWTEAPPGRTMLAGVPGDSPAGWRAGYRALGEGRSLGSIAYEMAMVAAGHLHICVFQSPRIWDVAAGVVLVQEAGGLVYQRSRGRRSRWQTLERFEQAQASLDGANPLRTWSGSLLAGRPESVERFLSNSSRSLYQRLRLPGRTT